MASVVHDRLFGWLGMASVVHDRLFGCLDGQRGARQTFWVSWDASLMASVVYDRLFRCLGMRV